MKTYVLTISEKFPKTHPKAGQPTNFALAIKYYEKIHTIRGNYDFWEKRFKKIYNGEAILSVRVWKGKPYNSKQLEIFRYDNLSKIGIEKLEFEKVGDYQIPKLTDIKTLSTNDGLSLQDFKDWFKEYDFSKPMAIIHFTPFRYWAGF